MSRAQPKRSIGETTGIITAPQLQRLWWQIIEKKTTLRVSNFTETRENNKRFICPCVHFSKPPQARSPSMKGKIEWDCHIHERRWSTHIPFASMFCFLILFDSLSFLFWVFHRPFVIYGDGETTQKLRIIFSTSLRFI